MTLRQVRTALKGPVYQEFRDARLQMRVSTMDKQFAEDNEHMAARLRELVPAAINVLERGLADPDLRIAVKAAVDVLDRDSRFNRTATINVEQRIPEVELERARELARELRKHTVDVGAEENTAAVVLSDREALPGPN